MPLLHTTGQRPAFDTAFELCFPRRVGAQDGAQDGEPADREDLRERPAAALVANDTALIGRLTVNAVDGLGGQGSSPPPGGWSSYRTLDRPRPQTLLARVRDEVRARGDSTGFGDRLLEAGPGGAARSSAGWRPRRPGAGSPSGGAGKRSPGARSARPLVEPRAALPLGHGRLRRSRVRRAGRGTRVPHRPPVERPGRAAAAGVTGPCTQSARRAVNSRYSHSRTRFPTPVP